MSSTNFRGHVIEAVDLQHMPNKMCFKDGAAIGWTAGQVNGRYWKFWSDPGQQSELEAIGGVRGQWVRHICHDRRQSEFCLLWHGARFIGAEGGRWPGIGGATVPGLGLLVGEDAWVGLVRELREFGN